MQSLRDALIYGDSNIFLNPFAETLNSGRETPIKIAQFVALSGAVVFGMYATGIGRGLIDYLLDIFSSEHLGSGINNIRDRLISYNSPVYFPPLATKAYLERYYAHMLYRPKVSDFAPGYSRNDTISSYVNTGKGNSSFF